jgi:hypothetical protein
MAIKRYALDIERTVRAKRLRDDGQVIRRFGIRPLLLEDVDRADRQDIVVGCATDLGWKSQEWGLELGAWDAGETLLCDLQCATID